MRAVHNALIISRKRIAKKTLEVGFHLGDKRFSYKPGQYIEVVLPHLKDKDPMGNKREFSIVSSPNQSNELAIAFRKSDSEFKKSLAALPINSPVAVFGPYGRFTLPADIARPLVFVAGGIGITPFISMLRYVNDHRTNHRIVVLYVNHDNQGAAYLEELKWLAKNNQNITLKNKTGRLTDRDLVSLNEENFDARYFIAGPPKMVEATKNALKSIDKSIAIETEEFTGEKEDAAVTINEADLQQFGSGMIGEFGRRSLSDLEALLQALSNTALVSETDASGSITYANDKFVEISKYSREELIGQNHRILKSGHHPKAFYKNMWATITRGRLWRGQIKNRAKDGTYYWVDTSIAPILGPDRIPQKYISVRFPITDQQQAEEELLEKARQQSVLTTLSQEALASTNLMSLLETAVLLLSKTLSVDYCVVEKLQSDGKTFMYEAGTGWDKEVLKNIKLSARITESMAGFILASKEPVIVEELATEDRFAGSAFLHDHHVVSGLGAIIHGPDRPFGVLGVYTKTKRVFSEDDINFVQAVANLLANAARNQLDKRKDEFLGIASHELKTPLTSIKTFIQLLQKEVPKKQAGRSQLFISKVDTQLDRLTSLIHDLLDISRINSGRIEYTDEEFSLGDLLAEIVSERELLPDKHKIEFKNGIDAVVFGDKYRIQQVVTNIINNAIKYSPDADRVIVRTEKTDTDVVVAVQDFGVGIPEHERLQVFDRFYQGNGVKKSQFPGGLGLGLFISAEIIRRHNGKIWVESEENKGSTFYFSLPIKQ